MNKLNDMDDMNLSDVGDINDDLYNYEMLNDNIDDIGINDDNGDKEKSNDLTDLTLINEFDPNFEDLVRNRKCMFLICV